MSSDSGEEDRDIDGQIVRAIEPVWINHELLVSPDGVKPLSDPEIIDTVDAVSHGANYELEDGTEFNDLEDIKEYLRLRTESEEKAQEFLKQHTTD